MRPRLRHQFLLLIRDWRIFTLYSQSGWYENILLLRINGHWNVVIALTISSLMDSSVSFHAFLIVSVILSPMGSSRATMRLLPKKGGIAERVNFFDEINIRSERSWNRINACWRNYRRRWKKKVSRMIWLTHIARTINSLPWRTEKLSRAVGMPLHHHVTFIESLSK